MDNGRKSSTRRSFETGDIKTKYGYSTGGTKSSAQLRGGTRQQSARYSDSGTARRKETGRGTSSGMNRTVTRTADYERKSVTKDKYAAVSGAPRRAMTDAERRKKLEQMRKRERLKRQRIRAALTFLLIVILIIIFLFMTPIFSVRRIVLNGNNLVAKEQIEVQIKDFVGDNLFRLRTANVEKKMKEIPLINNVAVEKKVIPPSLIINIAETKPAAYLLSGNSIVVVDAELKALDDMNSFDTNTIPSISGISVPGYKLNEIIQVDSEEKADILSEMLSVFANTGLTEHIKYISVDNLSDIRFNYDNRIEALCGSQLELERKIRMFAEAIRTDTMSPEAIGTMDLSVLGQATYQP